MVGHVTTEAAPVAIARVASRSRADIFAPCLFRGCPRSTLKTGSVSGAVCGRACICAAVEVSFDWVDVVVSSLSVEDKACRRFT